MCFESTRKFFYHQPHHWGLSSNQFGKRKIAPSVIVAIVEVNRSILARILQLHHDHFSFHSHILHTLDLSNEHLIITIPNRGKIHSRGRLDRHHRKLSVWVFLSLSLYIDIIQAHLELAREFSRFFCKENLTQKSIFFTSFGTPFARAKIMPFVFIFIWHEICCICHFGSFACMSVILCQ